MCRSQYLVQLHDGVAPLFQRVVWWWWPRLPSLSHARWERRGPLTSENRFNYPNQSGLPAPHLLRTKTRTFSFPFHQDHHASPSPTSQARLQQHSRCRGVRAGKSTKKCVYLSHKLSTTLRVELISRRPCRATKPSKLIARHYSDDTTSQKYLCKTKNTAHPCKYCTIRKNHQKQN